LAIASYAKKANNAPAKSGQSGTLNPIDLRDK